MRIPCTLRWKIRAQLTYHRQAKSERNLRLELALIALLPSLLGKQGRVRYYLIHAGTCKGCVVLRDLSKAAQLQAKYISSCGI
jgi:hypothetical protein